MDYSANFTKSAVGRKHPLFMRDPMELYDLQAMGVKLPHSPPAPTKIPKDIHWWERTSGGVKSQMTSPLQVNQGSDPLPMIMRMLRSGRGVR
jgi:hypothetical protein